MQIRRWTFKKHITLSLAVTMIRLLSDYIYLYAMQIAQAAVYSIRMPILDREAASIAIIGGADGPAAVYTTFKILNPWGEYLCFFLIMILFYLPIKQAFNNAFKV